MGTEQEIRLDDLSPDQIQRIDQLQKIRMANRKDNPMDPIQASLQRLGAVAVVKTGGLTEDATLGQILEMEIESWTDGDTPHGGEITKALESAASDYEDAVADKLEDWLVKNLDKIDLDAMRAKDADDVLETMLEERGGAAYLYFMEAEGHGVGTWDGDWDYMFLDNKSLKELSNYMERATSGAYRKLRSALEDAASDWVTEHTAPEDPKRAWDLYIDADWKEVWSVYGSGDESDPDNVENAIYEAVEGALSDLRNNDWPDGEVEKMDAMLSEYGMDTIAPANDRRASSKKTADLNDDDTLGQIIAMAVGSMYDEEPRHVDPSPEVNSAADKYGRAVEETLKKWVGGHLDQMNLQDMSMEHDAPRDAVEGVVEIMMEERGGAAYLYFMEAEGHGVGTWDGDWDWMFLDRGKKSISDLSKFVERALSREYQTLQNAIMEAADEYAIEAGLVDESEFRAASKKAEDLEEYEEDETDVETPKIARRRRARFEEGKPADPTEHMSPEEKAEWAEQNDKHEDKFKGAGDKLSATLGRLEQMSRFEEGKPADPTQNMSPEEAEEWEDNTDEHRDKFKAAARRRREARFPKGKPADPTANMSEEQKATWTAMNEEHRDKFKAAEARKAKSSKGDKKDPTSNMSEEDAEKFKDNQFKKKQARRLAQLRKREASLAPKSVKGWLEWEE